jgi:alkylation response protein AidB-like acyl-CoA dehydrogenase
MLPVEHRIPATEEQERKWLPPLVQAKAITGAAIAEPDAGSMAQLPTSFRFFI